MISPSSSSRRSRIADRISTQATRQRADAGAKDASLERRGKSIRRDQSDFLPASAPGINDLSASPIGVPGEAHRQGIGDGAVSGMSPWKEAPNVRRRKPVRRSPEPLSDKTMNASGYADGIVIFPSYWLLASGPLPPGLPQHSVQDERDQPHRHRLSLRGGGTSDSIQLRLAAPSHWAGLTIGRQSGQDHAGGSACGTSAAAAPANDDILLHGVYIHNSSFSTASPGRVRYDTSLTSGSAVVTALVLCPRRGFG